MAQKKAKKSAKSDAGSQTICKNKRASHRYALGDRYEAGLVLVGSEVKSCRAGQAHLDNAYVQIVRGEAVLVSGHIAPYKQAGHFNHEPDRTRKLLLHHREIEKLAMHVQQRGATLIPLALYFKDGRVKMELAIAKGKNVVDKRHSLKDKDSERDMRRATERQRQGKYR